MMYHNIRILLNIITILFPTKFTIKNWFRDPFWMPLGITFCSVWDHFVILFRHRFSHWLLHAFFRLLARKWLQKWTPKKRRKHCNGSRPALWKSKSKNRPPRSAAGTAMAWKKCYLTNQDPKILGVSPINITNSSKSTKRLNVLSKKGVHAFAFDT